MSALRIEGLAGRPESEGVRHLYEALDASAPDDYRQLAALVAHEWRERPPPLLGLGGGQGAGKSTLAALLVSAFEASGHRSCALGIDDFYLPRAARLELAERVHPLFETRGPPGTHDMALLGECIDALRAPGAVEVPVFDKGRDDRVGARHIDCGAAGVDVVVFEGWCVGARAVAERELVEPVNALEASRDARGVWRRYSNDALAGPYARVFDRIDALLFLRVPDLDAVRRWRLQQEEERAPSQRLTAEQVDAFVEHYERTTLAMLQRVPAAARGVVDLDPAHRVAGVALASGWRV